MNKQQAREIKAKTQRVETLVDSFEDDVSLLHDSSFDVTNDQSVAERQEAIQDELEQLTSDLLALLDQSGAVDREDGEIPLPGPKRRPVEQGNLPAPSNGRGNGPPPWAGGPGGNPGNGNSGNNGNGNSGNNGNGNSGNNGNGNSGNNGNGNSGNNGNGNSGNNGNGNSGNNGNGNSGNNGGGPPGRGSGQGN